jgi:hypothetical protein
MIDNEHLPEKMSDEDKRAFVREIMGHKKVNSESPAHIHITALPDGVGHKVVLHESGGEDSEHHFQGHGSHHEVAELVRRHLASLEDEPSDSSQGKPSGQFERYRGHS